MKKKYLKTRGSFLKLSQSLSRATGSGLSFYPLKNYVLAAFFLLTTATGFAQGAYCVPIPGNVNGGGITNVTIGSINNTTVAEAGNYGNYSNQIVNAGQSVLQPFSITLAVLTSYSVKVWIDWNNDFDFDDEGEEIFTAISPAGDTATLTGSFTVPVAAALGSHRIRIGATILGRGTPPAIPCYTGFNGAFEDYTLNVTPPPTCFMPVNPATANVSSGFISASWQAPVLGNIPVGYEYAVTQSVTPPASGIAVTGTTVASIGATLNGYLHVRSNCGGDDYSAWATVSYFNGRCTPETAFVDGDGITNVTIGTINNTTGLEEGNYGDFSSQVVNIGRGVIQPFSITLAVRSSFNTKIWIDWNDNLSFDDPEDEVYSNTSSNTRVAVLNGTFTVPADALLGNHRLRIGTVAAWNGPVNSCNSIINAAYEDYTVNVTASPGCFTPTQPVGTPIDLDTSNINWAAPSSGTPAGGYEYAVTTFVTPPATGIATTLTSANNITVAPHAVNYIHVRANCGNGNYSAWFTAPYYNQYCSPEALFVDRNGITNVTIGTINNTTALEDANYGDFTAQSVTVGQGVTQLFSISLNTQSQYNTKIWVDWNNDYDFDDEGEEVYTSVSPVQLNVTMTGYFTVPLTAILGDHRLRVGTTIDWNAPVTACFTGDNGAYEDYTLTVTTPPSCYTPLNITAQSVSAGVSNLSWTAPGNRTVPTGYEYAITATYAAPATAGTAVTGTLATNATVPYNVASYLHVRTNCGNGNFSEWVTVPFFNGYCTPQPGFVNGNGITNFTTGNINNSTERETGNYGNFAAQVVNIGQGVTQQFSITLNVFIPYNVKIWIDWNDDLDFDDEGESVYTTITQEVETAIIGGTFTVPLTAVLGNHRLRIGINPGENEGLTSCSVLTNAAFEDYTINVTPPPTCYTPMVPAGIATAANTANLSWAAPILGTTPTGYEYAVTTSLISPESGTAVTDAFVNGYTGIADNTYYYLHVRTNCGNGDYSEWVVSQRFRYLAGNTCATAVDLTARTSPYSSTTTGADNVYTPSCYNTVAPDLFYSIQVPNGFTLTIGVTEIGYYGVYAVFYGACAGNEQTEIACSETDIENVVWENLTGSTQTVYWVQDGWGSGSGAFTLAWQLSPPAACDTPRQLSTNVTSLTTTNVSWIAPNTGSPAGYEYAVNNSQTPPADGTFTTALSATGIAITPNVLTYLHVRSACGEDGFSDWETYEFFSGYCVPQNTESTDFYISGITTSGGDTNISNTGTGFSGYTDYTATHSVSTYAGGTFSISATHPSDEYIYSVWVDWNNDFDFTDSNERIFSTDYVTSPAVLGSVIVPVGTPLGNYRMRIRNAFSGSPVPVCGNQGYGEAEDYTLTVIAAPTCFAPYGLAIEPTDSTTTNLRWSPPELGSAPQGYEYVLSTTATAPAGNGTPTTAIFIPDVVYNPAQSVYLFVRSICGDADFSEWATTSILDTDVPQLLEKSITVFKEGSSISITSSTALITGVTIYDIRGSKLYTQPDVNNSSTVTTGLQIQQQVVIVEVITTKGKVSKRLVF